MFKKKAIMVLLSVCLAAILLAGCAGGGSQSKADVTIKFADAGWDSIKFHNAVAMFIIQHGMDYKAEEVSGTTTLTYQALKNNDIDVYMETWSDNLATYKDDVANGSILELGLNYGDNAQGLYVPRYVTEGDSKRNIKAAAPDLKTVEDLKKYKDLFNDPESPGKGRIYGAIPGWEVDKILYNKYMSYGLDKYYTYFRPGSDAALAAAISKAYEQGQPVVGYYWEPTWLTGKYDLVKLQDTPYNQATFKEGTGDFPAVPVTICAAKNITQKAPDVAEFLKKYKTSSTVTAQALAYMADNKASYETTAKWFLKNNENLWRNWVTSQQFEKVKAALN